MTLTLVIPGLLWPRQVMQDTLYDADFPALQILLGKGRRLPATHRSASGWWSSYFEFGGDELPAAPLRLAAAGHAAGDAMWVCADLVHLHTDRHGATLKDPSSLELNADAASRLHAAIAPLFIEVGELVMTSPMQWHLRLKVEPPRLPPRLDDIVGHSAIALLPEGDSGRHWRQLITEVQMCLHASPINQTRESLGLPGINSIALWGAGCVPSLHTDTDKPIFSDDPMVTGAAKLAGVTVGTLPRRFDRSIGNSVLHWDRMQSPAWARDALAWRDALQHLEQDWLMPVLASLMAGDLSRIELHGFGDDRQISVSMTSFDRYRFWRKPRRLESL